MKKIIIQVLLLGIGFAACQKPEDLSENGTNNPEQEYTINIPSTENTSPFFDPDGGNIVLNFTASAEWTASIIETKADSWIDVSPKSGNPGSSYIIISVSQNDTYDERSATIQLKCGAAEKNIMITQEPKKVEIIDIPDPVFRAYCIDNFDKNHDGLLYAEEILDVTYIDVTNKKIQSLQGIEFFTNLTRLECGGNQLTNLDLSACPDLDELHCDFNQLTNLDVRRLKNLKFLYCSNNYLQDLDLSNCTDLEALSCYSNQFTNLDVRRLKKLKYLLCDNNYLQDLDLSNCTDLEVLWCYSNQLTNLDVSVANKLGHLVCNDNKLMRLNVNGCSALRDLDCSDNRLTNLDVSAVNNLEFLDCYNNHLTELNIRNCVALRSLLCHDNNLPSLNVNDCAALKHLWCYNNDMTILDISKTAMNGGVLLCEMPTLEVLILKKGWILSGINNNDPTSVNGIHPNTKIIYVD